MCQTRTHGEEPGELSSDEATAAKTEIRCIYCNKKPRKSKRYCVDCLKKPREQMKTEHKVLREEALTYYGKACACCGEDRVKFLTIDHTNGGGNKHRKEKHQESTSIDDLKTIHTQRSSELFASIATVP
jgi:hypothetical protein